ncbi:MAG: undecaprenyl-phosphate glucose phosphotransferase [Candidatus Omnitrophica bacterium]|nr:undecaprenyl-phosphate glucose phosphotransferase [Candidatus Omnitrophota bacterium]
MLSHKHRLFSLLCLLMDSLAIAASLVSTYHFRFYLGILPLHGTPPDLKIYLQALVVIIPVYLWFFRIYGLYSQKHQRRRVEEIFQVVKAVTFAVIILMAVTFFYRELTYSRIYLITLWVFSILYVSLGRYLLIQYEYQRKLQQKDICRVLLIGSNRNARHIIEWAHTNKHYGRKVIGVLTQDVEDLGKHLDEIPILGTIPHCETFIQDLQPQEVILLDHTLSREKIADLVALCEDRFIDFKIGADIYGLMSRNVDVTYMSTVPLLGFNELPLDDPWNRVIKRTFDLLVSSFMLLVTSPIWIITTALIKLQDGGPIFYFQERMGRDQKIFKVIKFRTMKMDAEKETGPVWAKKDDTRRTSMGTFLRRWNIDELPQLFNVLNGDMSLVGPRPERPHFIDQFRTEIPRYMARHKIKSGLTGWAQVNGYRGNTSIEERIKYDLYYMENWSIVLDIEILFMTLFAFKNAY